MQFYPVRTCFLCCFGVPGSERATAAGEPSRHAHTAGRRTQKPGRVRERPSAAGGGGRWERQAVWRLGKERGVLSPRVPIRTPPPVAAPRRQRLPRPKRPATASRSGSPQGGARPARLPCLPQQRHQPCRAAWRDRGP